MAQNWHGNMGPFGGVTLKGNARVNAVPMFVDKLPLTLGGIAGEDIPFGRVVSIKPSDGRRTFYLGKPDDTYVVKGISMMDPSIMRADPAMQNYYFATRPMTVTTFGILDILEYDLDGTAPFEGAKVGFNKTTGEIVFGNTVENQLNASIYETVDPNGAKVFFNFPMDYVAMTTDTRSTETIEATATPVITWDSSTSSVTITCETPGAKIYYTIDGEDPDWGSTLYTAPFSLDASCTVKAIAVAAGYDTSTTASQVITIE